MSSSLDEPLERVHKAIEALEHQLEAQVWLIASCWKGARCVNLDQEVGWIFDEWLALHDDALPLALVLWGRGGDVVCADKWRRMWRGAGLMGRAYLLGDVHGIYSLMALCAHDVVFWPGAGMCAFDGGLLGPAPPDWTFASHQLLPSGLELVHPEQRKHALSMANERLHQKSAHVVFEEIVEGRGWDESRLSRRLGVARLGDKLGLDPVALEACGVHARWMLEPERSAISTLRKACASFLELESKPHSRYVKSGIGQEVEFDLSTKLQGALLATAQKSFICELDSGNPNPDTGLYAGTWYAHFV